MSGDGDGMMSNRVEDGSGRMVEMSMARRSCCSGYLQDTS